MDWENLTLSDVRRLVATLKRANANPSVIRAIIEHEPVEPMEHSRVTLGTLVKLLNQLNGKTVLSGEDLQLLNRPDEPAIVQPTFAKLLAACHFMKISSDFNEVNFPLIDDKTTGPVEAVQFVPGVGMINIIDFFDHLGFVPVGIRRALEWRALNKITDPTIITGAINKGSSGIADEISYAYFFGSAVEVSQARSYGNSFVANCRHLVCRK